MTSGPQAVGAQLYHLNLPSFFCFPGNVLIRETDEEALTFELDERSYTVQSNGVRTAIIDYTLSRFTKNQITIFQDLEDWPEIFEGKGDIQYDVYRRMQKLNGGDWAALNAATNVAWLDYLLDKLVAMVRKPRRDESEERDLLRSLRAWKAKLKKQGCSSCVQAVELLLTNDDN